VEFLFLAMLLNPKMPIVLAPVQLLHWVVRIVVACAWDFITQKAAILMEVSFLAVAELLALVFLQQWLDFVHGFL
jgi:hypothetical protein